MNRHQLLSVLLFLIGGILSTSELHAQILDTAIHVQSYSSYRTIGQIHDFNFESEKEDSTFGFSHQMYRPKYEFMAMIDQGQMGTPVLDLSSDLEWAERFSARPDLFTSYDHDPALTKFYTGDVSRTFLKFSQGTGDLIYLQAQHSQNVFDRWSFGLDYTRLKQNNVYYGNVADFTKYSIPNMYNSRVYSHFYTLNRKYEVFTSFNWNKNTVGETGGITDINRFDTLVGRQKYYFNTARISGGSNVFNKAHWSVTQFLRDGDRMVRTEDTTVKDSIYTNIKAQWYHQMDARWGQVKYTDESATDAYYPNNLYDLSTSDSMRTFSLKNRFGRDVRTASDSFKASAFAEHELASVRQFPGHEARYHNVRLGVDLLQRSGSVKLTGKLRFSPMGFYSGDLLGEVGLQVGGEKSTAMVKGLFLNRQPDFGMSFFGSNHYYWFNDLRKMFNARVVAQYTNKPSGLSLSAQFDQIDRYVYFDTSGLPQQLSSSFTRIKARLSHEFSLWDVLFVNNLVEYQKATSEFMRIPEFAYKGRLYLQGMLFKGNMEARIGVEAYYMSEFDGLTYNPVTRRFEFNDERSTGGYPYLDFFLNAKVNTMEIFVLMQNASDGWFRSDYYSATRYPMLYRALRFGLAWRLFN